MERQTAAALPPAIDVRAGYGRAHAELRCGVFGAQRSRAARAMSFPPHTHTTKETRESLGWLLPPRLAIAFAICLNLYFSPIALAAASQWGSRDRGPRMKVEL